MKYFVYQTLLYQEFDMLQTLVLIAVKVTVVGYDAVWFGRSLGAHCTLRQAVVRSALEYGFVS